MQTNTKIVNFGKINKKRNFKIPNLIGTQLDSFQWFIQAETPPAKRNKQGLQAVFEDIFPIESPHDDVVLEFQDYEIGEPKYSEIECKERAVTYGVPLKATIRLIRKETMEVREQSVYMGDIPIMTPRATFIINGAERVVVNQLHRSPGIFFFYEEAERVYYSRVIPDRGSWLEFEMDSKGFLIARIDRKKKFPVTMLIRALGYETNEEILRLFYETEEVQIDSPEKYDEILERRTIKDIVSPETGEFILDAGGRISIDILDRLKEENIKDVEVLIFPTKKEDLYLINCFEKDTTTSSDEAVVEVHRLLRPGEPSTVEAARSEIDRLFFNPRSYSFGGVGRFKINTKFRFDKATSTSDVLTKEDIVAAVKYLICLIAEADGYSVDDIDHLGNRRVRAVGELIANQIKIGFQRMERVIRERMTIQDMDVATPQALISIKPISAVLNEFFGSSQLSQFMDQTNPLAEITHKRRLNSLGPGGLSRDRAGFEVRDVHHSHYGRVCPIETPEGPNIGLILSMSTHCKINEYGFMETPYVKVKDGVVTGEIEYLNADEEDRHFVGQSTAEVDDNGKLVKNFYPCRNKSDFVYKTPAEISYIDVAPQQIFSISACMIPFLDHDDANRALMGCNMQRQAVPLLVEDPPLVGTGIEEAAAYDSGVLVKSSHAGVVKYSDAARVEIEREDGQIDKYPMLKFKRSNQGTCFNQRPVVKEGEKIAAGDVLADGPSTKEGRLSLGKNLMVAFMPWMGYNFEDAILINERIVREDVLTSLHIEQFEIEARETKLGREVVTRDIPNLSERDFRDLEEDGVVRIGAHVSAGGILVGKVTPKGEQDLTPEYKLLHSIFGEKAREVRDTSLRVPNGVEGTVIDVKRFSRENGDELSAGVEELVKVYICSKRKIQVGDKIAGRHGNKGVISRVLPEYDMPYLPDGTPLDIVLNPLGVPSRMNLGQLLETELGWAASELGVLTETPIFDGASEADVRAYLKKAGLPEDSKQQLYDGRTGQPFESRVMVGKIYMIKLAHMVDDKMHARSTGPYSLVTQQPLGGKAQFGGQRLGEMEVWALEAYGAAYTLQELLTVKSDDMLGRARIYEAIVKGTNDTSPGVPESFNVLIQELRGLALDVRIYDGKKNEISLAEWSEGFSKPKKIKLDTLINE